MQFREIKNWKIKTGPFVMVGVIVFSIFFSLIKPNVALAHPDLGLHAASIVWLDETHIRVTYDWSTADQVSDWVTTIGGAITWNSGSSTVSVGGGWGDIRGMQWVRPIAASSVTAHAKSAPTYFINMYTNLPSDWYTNPRWDPTPGLGTIYYDHPRQLVVNGVSYIDEASWDVGLLERSTWYDFLFTASPSVITTWSSVANTGGATFSKTGSYDLSTDGRVGVGAYGVSPTEWGTIVIEGEISLPSYTLTYTAGANGSITGSSPQTVHQNFDGTQVTATPAANYHFTSWSDSVLTAARTDLNVVGDITVTANFAIDTHTLTYTAGANGSVTGTNPQTINHGSDGTAVTAVPNSGYRFVDWSDTSIINPRTDTNVTTNLAVTANFMANRRPPSSSGSSVVLSPSITIRTPASGVSYNADAIVGLDWSSANGAFTKYKIYYSSDNGTTYSAIGETTSTSLSWTVPDVGTTQGKIKVEGYDAARTLLASATSNGNFVVVGDAILESEEGTQPTTTPPVTDSTATGTYSPTEALENTPDINTDMNLTLVAPSLCTSGSLIKGSLSSVYYCGANGKRYVFVNDRAYFSWYQDFSTIKTISDADLALIPLGGNITYRPGSRMIKIQSDPRVYVISRGGILRWVSSEAIAAALYGANWATMIDDVSDAFFVNYTVGAPI